MKRSSIEGLYIYDGQNEIGMYQNDTLQQLRILYPDSSSEHGAAVFLKLQNETFIPLHDIGQNVIQLLDTNGLPQKTYRYTAFGINLNPSHPNPGATPANALIPKQTSSTSAAATTTPTSPAG